MYHTDSITVSTDIVSREPQAPRLTLPCYYMYIDVDCFYTSFVFLFFFKDGCGLNKIIFPRGLM